MSKRIVVDPITRIEGHLRIDVEVDGGSVTKAWSSGQMWRGIENILQGRDPRDAWLFTQRFCGVCTTVHAIASVRAVENAVGIEIPLNAQYIRNLILAAHGMHDHIVHFYHLSALDWVDVVSALDADPAVYLRRRAIGEDELGGDGSLKAGRIGASVRVEAGLRVEDVVDRGGHSLRQDLLGHESLSLNLEETLIALSISSTTNPTAAEAMAQLPKLSRCELHLTHLPTPGDERGLRRLGVNLTCDPRFATNKLFVS